MAVTAEDRDLLYARPLDPLSEFGFDDAVARVFPDMIRRSVPGYGTMLEMIGVLASQLVQPGSRCYDLGCSLGAVSYVVAAAACGSNPEIIAVDSSEPMIRRLSERMELDPPPRPVRALCADVRDLEIQDASLVVMNLTLQFIPPGDRLALLRRIRDGLRPNGALILSEKVRLADPEGQGRIDALHHAFKRRQGYSELEISQKRTALERVLVPDTLDAHRARLDEAGFSQSLVWFQCLGFASLLAWR